MSHSLSFLVYICEVMSHTYTGSAMRRNKCMHFRRKKNHVLGLNEMIIQVSKKCVQNVIYENTHPFLAVPRLEESCV
jgi:hypothetical protein